MLALLDFVEDNRTSMERYPRQLLPAIRSIAAGRFRIDEYRPRYVRPPIVSRGWADRFARYCAYPAQARKEHADFFHVVDHGYAHLLSVLDSSRTVVTVHDLIPLLQANGELGSRVSHPLAAFSARFLRKARAIITISENTKKDVSRLLGIDPGRIHAVHMGLGEEFRPTPGPKEELRRRVGLPAEGGPVILVSGRQFYKNQATSVRVLARVIEMGHRNAILACLSGPGAEAETLAAQLGIENRLVRLKGLSEEQLVTLYSAADCLLFPSTYEGFGWPPSEAMACGLPVVCSNAAALPEVVGSAAVVSEPMDVEGHARGIDRIITDPAFRDGMISRGIAQAARFSWEACARGTLSVYEGLSR